jgi:hypothetical protein
MVSKHIQTIVKLTNEIVEYEKPEGIQVFSSSIDTQFVLLFIIQEPRSREMNRIQ